MKEKPAENLASEKEKRLQEALRANLRRRKKQDHIPPTKKKASV